MHDLRNETAEQRKTRQKKDSKNIIGFLLIVFLGFVLLSFILGSLGLTGGETYPYHGE